MSKYLAKIGLEMHCEVSETNSKVFSSARNSYEETPNCKVSPVDMAFPGTLPVVNKECVRKSLMMSLILNCKQPEYLEFDRKNYYYPDLPKGYQITQFTSPVGVKGKIEIEADGKMIPVEKIEHIWDEFYKEESADNQVIKSSGLGLAITKNILILHNAKYGCTSVNGNTKFWFTI